jgi:DNA replication protein DnaC
VASLYANPVHVLSTASLASAALDRLTHHCHTLVIRGQSYRQRGRRREKATVTTPSA